MLALSQLDLEPSPTYFHLHPSVFQMEVSEDLNLGDLPEDIVRVIFEILVEDDKCRPTYTSVSKQIQSWYINPSDNVHVKRTESFPIGSSPSCTGM